MGGEGSRRSVVKQLDFSLEELPQEALEPSIEQCGQPSDETHQPSAAIQENADAEREAECIEPRLPSDRVNKPAPLASEQPYSDRANRSIAVQTDGPTLQSSPAEAHHRRRESRPSWATCARNTMPLDSHPSIDSMFRRNSERFQDPKLIFAHRIRQVAAPKLSLGASQSPPMREAAVRAATTPPRSAAFNSHTDGARRSLSHPPMFPLTDYLHSLQRRWGHPVSSGRMAALGVSPPRRGIEYGASGLHPAYASNSLPVPQSWYPQAYRSGEAARLERSSSLAYIPAHMLWPASNTWIAAYPIPCWGMPPWSGAPAVPIIPAYAMPTGGTPDM